MNPKTTSIAGKAVIIHQGKVLLQNMNNQPFWHFPGGAWEVGDASVGDATRREAREETGMDIIVDKLIHVQEYFFKTHMQVELFYRAEPVDSSQYNEFHIDTDFPEGKNHLVWYDFEELQNLDVRPRAVAEKITQIDSLPEIYTCARS